MDLPTISSYEDQAIDTVVYVLNKAITKIGQRQNLSELAASRKILETKAKVKLSSLKIPLAITGEKKIIELIEKKWRLTRLLMYFLKYHGTSTDECAVYYYYEAIFSQPTAEYPIPQVTASVFFRIQDKQVLPTDMRGVPTMTFRIEGQYRDYDVRYVLLTPEWILAVLMMKIKFFSRIEALGLF